MKNHVTLLLTLLSATAVANELTLSQKLAIASFGEGNYPVGSLMEKRAARALDNVRNLCSEGLKEPLLLSNIAQDLLSKEEIFVTPLEIIEAIGTLKRQAPEDRNCQQIVTDYISTAKMVETPTEALASVNSLYKILKSHLKNN